LKYMSGLARYPTEAAMIGRLLTGYADLEIDLLHCVQMATGDFDTALKAMFRTRGESARITHGADLGRPPYAVMGLDTVFDVAVNAMRHCLAIRNQYAHHNFWDDNTGQLAIGDLEAVARLPGPFTDLDGVTPLHVDAALLQEQEAYFRYTDALLGWVNFEGRFKRGMMPNNPVPKPVHRTKAALYLP
jgi:hypothetical protein